MIKYMKKRVVAFLLAFAMVLTMVPNTVQAASNSTTAKKAVGKTNPNGVMDIPFYKTELFKDKTFYKIVSSHRVEYGFGYGYAKDAQEYAKYLQKKITTASEFMYWLAISGYYYNELVGYTSYVKDGWSMNNTPERLVECGFGVCCDTSDLFVYLVGDDYEEAGYVVITGDRGHQYNYVKNKGKYYLLDFTNFTSFHEYSSMEDCWNRYKDEICFWSGKSLKSDSAKIAACKHDNHEWEWNHSASEKYDYTWNNNHTAAIIAVPYYKGLYVPPSTYRDDCYQDLKAGIDYNGKKYYLNEIAIGFQKGVLKDSYVLYLNNTKKYKHCSWKLIDIPVKEIPWYCYTVPGTDKESTYDKMCRQMFGNSDNEGYGDYGTDSKRGIRRGAFLTLRNMAQNGYFDGMTSKQICEKYNLRTKY